MLEKAKMLKGLLYNPNVDVLIKDRQNCKELCFKYNKISPKKISARQKLIEKIVGKTKKNFLIEQPFVCDYGYNIEIGENFYSNHNLVILDPAKVSFGDNVFIGPNCAFYTPLHPLNFKERNKGFEYAAEIKVGSNVWIGGNVVVLPGVTIGDNAVIGAGSVVTKSIPDNVIAYGNPCRVVRKIMEDNRLRLS